MRPFRPRPKAPPASDANTGEKWCTTEHSCTDDVSSDDEDSYGSDVRQSWTVFRPPKNVKIVLTATSDLWFYDKERAQSEHNKECASTNTSKKKGSQRFWLA
ncbi:uncharacterized protein LOC144032242 [Festucalex cinctus]